MPYLTLWEKILQNLAHLEANSHKIFQIPENCQTILQHILWRININPHFVTLVLYLYLLNKGFWLFWGAPKWFL